MSVLGERLKRRRLSHNIDQKQFAQIVGISQAQISRYECGESDPSGSMLTLLARKLQTSTDYLLGLTDNPHPHPIAQTNSLSQEEEKIIGALRDGLWMQAIAVIVDLYQKTDWS